MLLISRFESFFFGLKMCGNGDLKWDVIQNGEKGHRKESQNQGSLGFGWSRGALLEISSN